MTPDEVKAVYLGQSTRFPNGEVVQPVDQSLGSPDRTAFVSAVLGMDERRLKRHWSKLIFSSKGKPPNGLENADVVMRWVSRNPHGIGYVDAGIVDPSVQILLRVK